MKKIVAKKSVLAGLLAVAASFGFAEVPLNNLSGQGGIAFNPLAYTAGKPFAEDSALNGKVSKPQAGLWYILLDDADIDWVTASAAITFFDRLEVSYGYGFIHAPDYGDKSISAHNIGAKLRFLDENAWDQPWIPALAAGTVWKYTDSKTVDAFGLDDNGFDAYLVASKLITQLPLPVLISGGILWSDEVVYGVVGHNDYDVVGFGNIDILPAKNVAVGAEYRQGVDAGDGIQNSDYWDGHVAWFVNDQLTLVGAWTDTGRKDKGFNDLGVGSGLVLSVQYQF